MWNLALLFPIKPCLLIGRRKEVMVRVHQLATLALPEHYASRHNASCEERAGAHEKTAARWPMTTGRMVASARVSSATIIGHGLAPRSCGDRLEFATVHGTL